MLVSWFFLTVGSAILAFVVTLQVKTVSPAIIPVMKYNLIMLPLFFLANVVLGVGFIRANLTLVVASQSFIYYTFLLTFSVLLVGDRISVIRAVMGFALVAAGVAVLGRYYIVAVVSNRE